MIHLWLAWNAGVQYIQQLDQSLTKLCSIHKKSSLLSPILPFPSSEITFYCTHKKLRCPSSAKTLKWPSMPKKLCPPPRTIRLHNLGLWNEGWELSFPQGQMTQHYALVHQSHSPQTQGCGESCWQWAGTGRRGATDDSGAKPLASWGWREYCTAQNSRGCSHLGEPSPGSYMPPQSRVTKEKGDK